MQTSEYLAPLARSDARALVRSGWVVAAGLTVGALTMFLIYFVVLNQATPTWWPDAYEYAVVARNVAQGRGLTVTAHYVLDTYLLRQFSLPLPYVHHDIGLPLLMAAVLALLGANNTAVAWTGGIFYILIIPLTFLFGWKLYNKYVGLFAALLALINVQLVGFSTTGLSEVPFAFFITLFWFALYRQKTRLDILISGALFGWLWVLRSNVLSALPFVLLFLIIAPPTANGSFVSARRPLSDLWTARRAILTRIGLFLIGSLLVLSPTFWRNYATLGNPLYNVSSKYSLVFYTNVFEGKNKDFVSLAGIDVEPVQYILTHPDQLWSKMNYQLAQTFDDLWRGGLLPERTLVDAIEIVLLLLTVIIPRPNETTRQRLFRWTIYLCIASALLVGSMTHLRWRHLYGFLPIVLIFISEFLLRVTDLTRNRLQFRINPLFGIALFTIVLAIPSWYAILQTVHTGQPLDDEYRQMASLVRETSPDNALVLIRRGA